MLLFLEDYSCSHFSWKIRLVLDLLHNVFFELNAERVVPSHFATMDLRCCLVFSHLADSGQLLGLLENGQLLGLLENGQLLGLLENGLRGCVVARCGGTSMLQSALAYRYRSFFI